ncbi:MAG TPA: NUDIX hydrolase [Candidatus Nanoarchaeia archaeon]|nr:NUDIX hydrolase [Candidatus Nanoarchaeia archaeon]
MTQGLDELVAVLHKGKRIGVPRKQSIGMVVLTAHVLLFNPKGEILLTQRSTISLYGKWDVGITETLRSYETFMSAAKRGLNEELQMDYRNMPFLAKQSEQLFKDGLFKRQVFTYSGTYAGEIKPNQTEVMAFEWVCPTEAVWQIQSNARPFRDLSAKIGLRYLQMLQHQRMG